MSIFPFNDLSNINNQLSKNLSFSAMDIFRTGKWQTTLLLNELQSKFYLVLISLSPLHDSNNG